MAQMQKIPYMIIVGENEAENKTISVRMRGNVEEKDVKPADLIKRMKTEIKNKTR